MRITSFLITILLSLTMTTESEAFEYRIVTNASDSTLNGMEVSLFNESDIFNEYFGEITDGGLEIKGESSRSFPATILIRDKEPGNNRQYLIRLIVEPGTIVVSPKEIYPLSGGVLNDRMKDYMKSLECVGFKRIPANEISRKVFEDNIGNGLGEYALINYGEECSPEEWTDAISLIDEDTKNLTKIITLSERKERIMPVWEGKPFRDVSGKSLDGKPVTLSQYVGNGKYVVADFWSSWCRGCILEAREYIIPLYDKYKENPNITFLGLALDDISDSVKKHGIQWEQIMNCQKLMGEYVVNAIPETILFAPDGTILKRFLRGEELAELLESLPI